MSISLDGKTIPAEYMWLLDGLASICIVTIHSAILGPHDKNNTVFCQVLEIIGGLSLEMYMSHIIILYWFTYYGLTDKIRGWLFPVIVILSLPVSEVVHLFVEKMNSRVTSRL